MNINDELIKLIDLAQREAMERSGPDRDYYRAAVGETQKQKELIIKEFDRLEEALNDRDLYYFTDRTDRKNNES